MRTRSSKRIALSRSKRLYGASPFLSSSRNRQRWQMWEESRRRRNFVCICCGDFNFLDRYTLRDHYVEEHELDMYLQEYEFESFTSFNRWREDLRVNEGHQFSLQWRDESEEDGIVRSFFKCAHDTAKKGSSKKGITWCPARLAVFKTSASGTVCVEYRAPRH